MSLCDKLREAHQEGMKEVSFCTDNIREMVDRKPELFNLYLYVGKVLPVIYLQSFYNSFTKEK